MGTRQAALAAPDFRRFISARFLALAGHQMMIVALSQAVYEATHDPIHLGYIGLTFFVPKVAFTLWAGQIADRYARRNVIVICRSTQTLLTLGLIAITFFGLTPLWLFYAAVFALGTAYAFDGPSSQSIVTQLVPEKDFHNAVTWNSANFQAAFIAGPALGGWLYALLHGAPGVLWIVFSMRAISAVLMTRIQPRTDHVESSEVNVKTVLAGLSYVFRNRIILGAISLDLFAVLLGGATALMPVFANDILKVGAWGLGFLRTAPAVGAAIVAVALAYMPPMQKAGKKMFACVAVFGLSTVLFGLSRNFYFSLVCLFFLGAADMISVIIRQVLIQVQTPPSMRGRVSAVNLIFIGASNELGEFESGITASWFGTVPAVVLGGLGTLAVVALYSWRFPEIREYDRLKTDPESVKTSVTESGEEKKTS
jgi:MFS family permease